jgi:hypothetical protein
MQTVLHYSPIQTGVTYLPLTGGFIISSGIASQLFGRIGTKPVIVAGAVIVAGGLYWLSRIPVDGSYTTDILPGLLVVSLRGGGVFVGVTTAANAGVGEESRPRRRPPEHRPAGRHGSRSRDPLRSRNRAHPGAFAHRSRNARPGGSARVRTYTPRRRRDRARGRGRRAAGSQHAPNGARPRGRAQGRAGPRSRGLDRWRARPLALPQTRSESTPLFSQRRITR